MKKTLLLCFIHGFKGGESTFGDDYSFTRDLRDLVARALPKVNVKVVVYPKYDTRGDLGKCVSQFRDWLLNQVIDIEVEARTPSPTVDPSVRTILIGHSMGGIVAAETLVALTSDEPVYREDGVHGNSKDASLNGLMFPYVQGILAFDTPYLGIAPGVVAHGAEGHYQTASAAIGQISALGATFWGNKASGSSNAAGSSKPALPAPPPPQSPPPASSSSSQQQQQQGGGGWGRWGKMAAYAGAASALAASGAAAYYNRDHITYGWGWVSSHLEFVGCLAKGEDLRRRVAHVVRAQKELGVGFANLYTRLGAGAKKAQVAGALLGKDRTFCNLPSRMEAGTWWAAVNEKAEDEAGAHMTMFERNENPGYDALAEEATKLIAGWAENDWYESSAEEKPALEYKDPGSDVWG